MYTVKENISVKKIVRGTCIYMADVCNQVSEHLRIIQAHFVKGIFSIILFKLSKIPKKQVHNGKFI